MKKRLRQAARLGLTVPQPAPKVGGEVRLPAPVRAQYRKDTDDVDGLPTPPGIFEYYTAGNSEIAGMVYVCPCGCGARGALDFRLRPGDKRPDPGRPSWEWDGNSEEPTLTPSVHHVGHWHGYLRKGMWEQA